MAKYSKGDILYDARYAEELEVKSVYTVLGAETYHLEILNGMSKGLNTHVGCVVLDNEPSITLKISHLYIQSTTTPASVPPIMHQPGDILYTAKGNMIRIVFTRNSTGQNEYIYTFLTHTDPAMIGKTESMDIARGNKYLTGVKPKVSPSEMLVDVANRFNDIKPLEKQQCTCSSRDIFLKGCKCGYMKPYKPKLG